MCVCVYVCVCVCVCVYGGGYICVFIYVCLGMLCWPLITPQQNCHSHAFTHSRSSVGTVLCVCVCVCVCVYMCVSPSASPCLPASASVCYYIPRYLSSIRGHDLKWLGGCTGSSQIWGKNIARLTGASWPLLLHNSWAASWSTRRRRGGLSLDQNRTGRRKKKKKKKKQEREVGSCFSTRSGLLKVWPRTPAQVSPA